METGKADVEYLDERRDKYGKVGRRIAVGLVNSWVSIDRE
jgi:hypothetical protein